MGVLHKHIQKLSFSVMQGMAWTQYGHLNGTSTSMENGTGENSSKGNGGLGCPVVQLAGASCHKPKGRGFDSWTGPIPRLW